MRRRLVCLWMLTAAVACDAPAPDPTPRSAQVFVCGEAVADLVLALGAGRSVRGADTRSRLLPGLGAALDLGEHCRDAPDHAGDAALDAILLDGSDAGLAEALRVQGARVRVLDPAGINEVLRLYRELGALLGVETRVLNLTAEMSRGISRIAMRRDGLTRVSAVWLRGPATEADRWKVVGGIGMRHELLELAGAENAFHLPMTSEHVVSAQEVAAAGAEVVLYAAEADALPELPPGLSLRALPAALNRLPILDPRQRVEALHALLYPDAE